MLHQVILIFVDAQPIQPVDWCRKTISEATSVTRRGSCGVGKSGSLLRVCIAVLSCCRLTAIITQWQQRIAQKYLGLGSN